MGPWQQFFENILAEAKRRALAEGHEIPDLEAQVLEQLVPQLTTLMLKSLKREHSKALRREQKIEAGFRKRNYARWKKAFNMLELMWMISEEIGSKLNEEHRPQAAQDKDYLFETLTFLHSRSLLVTAKSSVLCTEASPTGR